MAFGTKTNERPGTRAVVRHVRMSAYKAREVLDLIRGEHVADADDILAFVERDAAIVIRKALASAVANATNNDGQDPQALYVSACFADEGPTLKRWRPRARGRASRIRKRTCHITIIVSRMSDDELARREAKATAAPGGRRSAQRATAARRDRVARSRQSDAAKAGLTEDDDVTGVAEEEAPVEEVVDEVVESEVDVDEAVADASDSDVADDAASDDDTEEKD